MMIQADRISFSRDSYMIGGLLVSSFPIVLGCDSSGVVVEVGKEAESLFKVGDRVSGCTRLGEPGYGTFQEYVCWTGKRHRWKKDD